MPTRAKAVVFDVNETLTDLSPLTHTFVDFGAPRELARTWFAALLRDAFALTVTADQPSFADIAEHNARLLLQNMKLAVSLDEAVSAVLQRLSTLGPNPDMVHAVRQLQAGGFRLFTLSNGTTATAERLFRESGVGSCFEQLLSVDRHTLWKPAREAYERVATVTGVALADSILVAVHPWDIHGATRAGMKTAWLNREMNSYPAYFESPTISIGSLAELAENLHGQ